MRFLIVMTTLMLLINASGCATGISREELLQEMQDGRSPVVIDVRSPGEYDTDHLPGALHIPFYSVSAGLARLNASKEERLVIYCEHGPRAGIAGLLLFFSGYARVYSLQGHMKGWRASQYPIETIAH